MRVALLALAVVAVAGCRSLAPGGPAPEDPLDAELPPCAPDAEHPDKHFEVEAPGCGTGPDETEPSRYCLSTSGSWVPAPGTRPLSEPAVPFRNETMTRPERISGPDPMYSRAALEARVTGTLQARCVITAAGRVRDCRIVKSLLMMERPVLEALTGRCYRPATLDGRAVNVRYTFTIKLEMPPRWSVPHP